jgi:hypothetical protein
MNDNNPFNQKKIITRSFISSVGTIEMIIANLVDRDANTLKPGTRPLAGLAGNLWSSASVFRRFVRSVTAVVFTVADERLVNAFRVVALEVVRLAVDRAAARRLVRLVLTVDGAVALPADRNADS